MALDGIFLHDLSIELAKKIIGSRVDRINQTQKTELIFSLRTRDDRFKLLVSASSNSPRLNITDEKIENPPKPPMFCMLMRKHLQGAVIEEINQVGLDRILMINFIAVSELGEHVMKTLVVEIMAQYSNIILLNGDGKIIDSIKRVDETKSSVRQILPGLKYELPPRPDKINLENSTAENAADKICISQRPLSKAILDTLEGVSPLVAREIQSRCVPDDISASELNVREKEKLLFELDILKNNIKKGKSASLMILDENGKPKDFSYMFITMYASVYRMKAYVDMSSLLDDFYSERERISRTKAKAEDLFRTVDSLIEHYSRKLDYRLGDLEKCGEKDEKKKYAELINANLYALKKGTGVYKVEDWYDDGKIIEIPARPDKTPAENSRIYFKEYRKLKTAEMKLTELISSSKEDIEYLKTVKDELMRSETEAEIAEIRQELTDGGYIKQSQKNGKNQNYKKNTKKLPPLKFKSPSGFDVLVGRNNIQNDRLSLKMSEKSDYWFHVQKAPGSHVILSLNGNEPDEKDMEYAARVAVYFSSERESPSAEVDYTKVKNLKKPNGAKPGFVIYHEYSSVLEKPLKPDDYDE